MKNNEGWNKITKLVSKWVNVLQGDKTHLWVILVTRLKKRITSPFLGLNHWWIGYGTESHPLRRPVGGGRLPGTALGWGSPVTNDSDASVYIGLASFRVRCSLPVDWSDGLLALSPSSLTWTTGVHVSSHALSFCYIHWDEIDHFKPFWCLKASNGFPLLSK